MAVVWALELLPNKERRVNLNQGSYPSPLRIHTRALSHTDHPSPLSLSPAPLFIFSRDRAKARRGPQSQDRAADDVGVIERTPDT